MKLTYKSKFGYASAAFGGRCGLHFHRNFSDVFFDYCSEDQPGYSRHHYSDRIDLGYPLESRGRLLVGSLPQQDGEKKAVYDVRRVSDRCVHLLFIYVYRCKRIFSGPLLRRYGDRFLAGFQHVLLSLILLSERTSPMIITKEPFCGHMLTVSICLDL